jgi:general secretion pathway protein L
VPTHICAIDLSERAAKLVVIESSLRTAAVIRAERLERAADEERDVFWKRVRASLPERMDSCIVNTDAAGTSARILEFPFIDQRKVDAAIQFELEGLLPYEMDDIATAQVTTDKGGNKARVLVGVMPKERLAERIATLGAVDIEARAIVPPAAGLAELAPPGDEPVAILSIGANESHLAVTKGGIRFVRTLRFGGEQIDRVIAKQFNIELAAAKQAKESEAQLLPEADPAADDRRRVSDAVASGLKPLLSELTLSLKALRDDEAPRKLLLTGGTSRLPGLAHHLSERLRLPVELLDVTVALGQNVTTKVGVAPEMSVAMGMALSLLRRGRAVPLSFRRGAFAYSGDIQLYRGELIRAGVGIAAVLLLALVGSIVQWSIISADEAKVDASLCQVTEKVVGRCIKDPNVAVATMKQSPGIGGMVIPQYSTADLYEMMSKAIGSEVSVEFINLELRLSSGPDDPDRITGKGEAADFETTERIVQELKRDKCVQEAEVSKQRKGRNDRVEFNFAAKVSCPPGYKPGSELGPVAAAAVTPTASAAPPEATDAAVQPAPTPPLPGMPVQPGTNIPVPLVPPPDMIDPATVPPDLPGGLKGRLPRMRRPTGPPGEEHAPATTEGGEEGGPRVTFPGRSRTPFRPPVKTNRPGERRPIETPEEP